MFGTALAILAFGGVIVAQKADESQGRNDVQLAQLQQQVWIF